MPELPEVETIRRGLEQHLVGCVITGVEVLFPRIISGDVQQCVGATVQEVRRFGKGLVIDLNNGYSIAVHVKMTGQLVVSPKGKIPQKHTHVIFRLGGYSSSESRSAGESRSSRQARTIKDEEYLYYNDVRRFGWLRVLPTDEVGELPFFKTIGKEPLKDLDLVSFQMILQRAKAPIKSLLMDQQKIAGIGNIYANDALYMAGIHPHRPSFELTEKEGAKLFRAIETVLENSIAVGGASANNYVNALGEKGTYQEHFLVYKKEGKPCKICVGLILRIKTGGRSTFFCPNCQK